MSKELEWAELHRLGVVTTDEVRENLGLNDPSPTQWVLTSVEWHSAVADAVPDWAAERANMPGNFEVLRWVHDIGLILRGRYTARHQRQRIWPLYLRAMHEHQAACIAAWRMGGPVAALAIATGAAFA